MSLSCMKDCRKHLKRSTSEVERQKQHYDRKASAISLEPGDVVLTKFNAYRGRRKVKDQWKEEPYKVEYQVAECIPSYLMKNQLTGCSRILHQMDLFSLLWQRGIISVWLCRPSGPGAHHHSRGMNSEGWDWGNTTKCKLPITGPASDRWDFSRVGK